MNNDLDNKANSSTLTNYLPKSNGITSLTMNGSSLQLHKGNGTTSRINLNNTSAIKSNNAGTADMSTRVRTQGTNRPTSANNYYGDASLRSFMVSSNITTANGHPGGDGHIIQCSWDTSSGYNAQLYLPNNANTSKTLKYRGQNGTTWNDWIDVLDTKNFSSHVKNLFAGNYVFKLEKSGTNTSTVTNTIMRASDYSEDKIILANAICKGYGACMIIGLLTSENIAGSTTPYFGFGINNNVSTDKLYISSGVLNCRGFTYSTTTYYYIYIGKYY